MSRRPSAATIDDPTRSGSLMASSGTNQTPSGKTPAALRASSTARLVLPVPPAPRRVTRRLSASSRSSSASSRSRPTKLVIRGGKVGRLDVDGPDRWEVRGQTVDRQLVQPIRLDEPAQAVFTEVDEGDTLGQRAARERHRRLRQEDLATVGRRRHPGGAVDVAADVVVATGDAFAGVETHPHADDRVRRPGLGSQRPLRLDGGGDGRRCVAEHDQERIALCPALDAVVRGAGRTQDRVVTLEDRAIGNRREPLDELASSPRCR